MPMLIQYARKLLSEPMARAGLMLTIANVLGGILSYTYQVIMGRILGPADFALFSAACALIMFMASPLNAMLMVISHRVTVLSVHLHFDRLHSFYKRSTLTVLIFFVAFIPVLMMFSTDLQSLLKSPSINLIWIFIGILLFSALSQINNAFYQGEQQFTLLAGTSLMFAAIKIPFGLFGIELGYGVEGALFGMMLATAIVWLSGLAFYQSRFESVVNQPQIIINNITFADVWPLLLANILFAMMTQLDMVLVNWLFNAQDAGQYAAVSVLGKAVLYLSGGVAFSLFPMVAEKHTRKSTTVHMLRQAVALVGFFSAVLALFYWYFAPWLVTLFYGNQFSVAGELLRWYGFAMIPMALVMVAEYYLLALRRLLFVWLLLFVAPIQIFAILIWHDNLKQVIGIIGFTGGCLVVFGFLLLWLKNRSNDK